MCLVGLLLLKSGGLLTGVGGQWTVGDGQPSGRAAQVLWGLPGMRPACFPPCFQIPLGWCDSSQESVTQWGLLHFFLRVYPVSLGHFRVASCWDLVWAAPPSGMGLGLDSVQGEGVRGLLSTSWACVTSSGGCGSPAFRAFCLLTLSGS